MRTFAIVLLLLAGVGLEPHPAGSQETFEGHELVRRVDVLVALESPEGPFRIDRSQPGKFSREDFSISLDGVGVDVQFVNASATESAAEPWQVVIYFDRTLSNSRLIASAASTLAQRVEQLVANGEVEVVVADPTLRRVLAPTSDAALLDETLSGIALAPQGRDTLTSIRAEAFSAHAGNRDSSEAVRALERRELELIERQQDRLLGRLTDRPGESSRRILFLVSGGFDLQPQSFYGSLGAGHEGGPTPAPVHQLMARTLASLGWVVFAVQGPEPDPLPRRWGLRRSLLVRLDGNWDPKRAEAELELAQSLIRQKKWKRAESALEDAIYHFHDQPKLRPQQAGAMMQLGEVLEELGRRDEAFRVYRRAVELDPSRAAQAGSALAGLLDPLAPMAELAEASAGGIVRSAQELEYLLDDFASRVRLGFQVEGAGDGAFSEIEVTYHGGVFSALSPRWVSHGPPAAVAQARSRRLLVDDSSVEGDSGRVSLDERPEAFCEVSTEGRQARLSIQIFPELPEGWEGLPLRYRVSVSAAAPGGARTRSEMVGAQDWTAGEAWEHQLEVEIDPAEPSVAFVVEEMNSGRWSGSLVECEAGF